MNNWYKERRIEMGIKHKKDEVFLYSQKEFTNFGKMVEAEYFGKFTDREKFLDAVQKYLLVNSGYVAENWIRERLTLSSNADHLMIVGETTNKLFRVVRAV